MTRPAMLLVLIASAAQAAGVQVTPAMILEAQGWTKDSRYFVWHPLDPEDNAASAIDMRTQRVIEIEDLDVWKKRNPLAGLKASRASVDGTAKADVRVLNDVSKTAKGWAKNRWTPGTAKQVELNVVRGTASAPSLTWRGPFRSARPFWSPDGLRIAWVIETSESDMGMGGFNEGAETIAIGPGQGPVVHLVADKSILAAATPKVVAALEAAGFAPNFSGPAKKARLATVVYCAAGSEEVAAKIAAAVPGGATVEKLSWESDAAVVVAIGKSALAGEKR